MVDRLDITQLLALYGHIIDERQWSRLNELFVETVVIDFRLLGSGRLLEGIDAVRAFWSSPEGEAVHPLAHLNTNFVITADEIDGRVRTMSKGLGVGRNGRVGAVTYEDVLLRTGDGWRIMHRTGRPRLAESIPEPS